MKHPNMKRVVTDEVERLLHRPNLSRRASYFSVVFLNQLVLTAAEAELARHLVAVYIGLVKALGDDDNSETQRMLGALLTGVHRSAALCSPRRQRKGTERRRKALRDDRHLVPHGA